MGMGSVCAHLFLAVETSLVDTEREEFLPGETHAACLGLSGVVEEGYDRGLFGRRELYIVPVSRYHSSHTGARRGHGQQGQQRQQGEQQISTRHAYDNNRSGIPYTQDSTPKRPPSIQQSPPWTPSPSQSNSYQRKLQPVQTPNTKHQTQAPDQPRCPYAYMKRS